MHLKFLLASCAVLAAAAPAVAPRSSYSLHQKREVESTQWVKRSRVSGSARIPMRIALAQSNLELGPDWLAEVSDPRSKSFGKHWSEDDVHRAFAPSDETVESVANWLIANNIDVNTIKHSNNKGWLQFETSAETAEDLFMTEYYEHEHTDNGRIAVACDEYYVPDHLMQHIDYVTPGVVPSKMKKSSIKKRDDNPPRPVRRPPIAPKMPSTYPAPPTPAEWQQILKNPGASKNGIPADLVNCSIWITPPCVRALYDVPLPSGEVCKDNSLGIFEEEDTYSQEDLNLFFTTFFPTIPNGTHPIPAFIDGAVAPVPVAEAGGESDLDMTLAYPLIYPQTITLYQTDDPIYAAETLNGTLDGFLDTFLDAIDGSFCTYSAYGQTGDNSTLDPTYPDPNPGGYKGKLQCGVYKPTNVISVSYGGGENGLPVDYERRQCNEFLKLALQGHTILFASGDYGVASFPSPGSPNGTCQGATNSTFLPSFPATCPWLTSVGATQIPVNGTVYDPEVAANAIFGNGAPFTSGGGFSNVFPAPFYQKPSLFRYFEKYNPPYPYYETLYAENVGANGGIYNRIGRGFPDVSAVGLFWLDFNEGEEGGWGGTSMSTPIVASIVNRIIEERLKIGKGPIGFLNPTLYFQPELLHDITSGHNLGCGTQGFNAVPGWDPVTGMGTPNYPALLDFYLRLP